MGFMDFFKKKQEPVKEIKKLEFEEIDDYLNLEKAEIQNKEASYLKEVRQLLSEFLKEFNEKVKTIEEIDLENKKIEERAKFVIKENLSYYINYLNKLTEDLKSLKEEKPSVLIEKINSLFSNFEKRSSTNFQKITFIIGKELEDLGKSISNFFSSMKKITNNNQNIFKDYEKISKIESILDEMKKTDILVSTSEEETHKIDMRIKSIQEEKGLLKNKLDAIKDSEKYSQYQSNLQKLSQDKEQLENQIQQLRLLIDFKKLAGFFHSNEKEMNFIKEFKSDFKSIFEKNNHEKILSLLKEAKIDTKTIKQEIQEIKSLQSQMKNPVNPLEKTEKEISSFDSSIEELNIQKVKETSKKLKFIEAKESLMENLKQELLDIGLELVLN